MNEKEVRQHARLETLEEVIQICDEVLADPNVSLVDEAHVIITRIRDLAIDSSSNVKGE
jgi:hypothetical protein